MSFGLVDTRPLTEVKNTPQEGHAAAVSSSVASSTSRVPSASRDTLSTRILTAQTALSYSRPRPLVLPSPDASQHPDCRRPRVFSNAGTAEWNHERHPRQYLQVWRQPARARLPDAGRRVPAGPTFVGVLHYRAHRPGRHLQHLLAMVEQQSFVVRLRCDVPADSSIRWPGAPSTDLIN